MTTVKSPAKKGLDDVLKHRSVSITSRSIKANVEAYVRVKVKFKY